MNAAMTDKDDLVEQVFAKYQSYCRQIGITPAEMMQQAYRSHLKSLTTEQLRANCDARLGPKTPEPHGGPGGLRGLSKNAQSQGLSGILHLPQ